MQAEPRDIAQTVFIDRRQFVASLDPVFNERQSGARQGGLDLRHPGVKPQQRTVVVIALAVVACLAQPRGKVTVVGCDETALTRDEWLGRGQAINRCISPACDRRTGDL